MQPYFFFGLRSALILFMRNKVNSLSTNCHKDLRPNLDPRALLGAWRLGRKSSGEPWSKIASDWFQQKTIKEFLIGPFKFARKRLNVWRVWHVTGLSINAYADDEQIHDSDKDPVRLADRRFGVNGMITNPEKHQAMVLGNTYHVFSFHVNSIKACNRQH